MKCQIREILDSLDGKTKVQRDVQFVKLRSKSRLASRNSFEPSVKDIKNASEKEQNYLENYVRSIKEKFDVLNQEINLTNKNLGNILASFVGKGLEVRPRPKLRDEGTQCDHVSLTDSQQKQTSTGHKNLDTNDKKSVDVMNPMIIDSSQAKRERSAFQLNLLSLESISQQEAKEKRRFKNNFVKPVHIKRRDFFDSASDKEYQNINQNNR